MKQKSLVWLKEVWETLEPECPGVHLAQMHQHLPWHKKEVNAAFKSWLPALQKLKDLHDPYGLMPHL